MDQKPDTKWCFYVFAAVHGIEQKKIFFKVYFKETYLNAVVETWLKKLDISF